MTPLNHLPPTPPAVQLVHPNAPDRTSYSVLTQGQISITQLLNLNEKDFDLFLSSNRDDHGVFLADNVRDCHTASLSLKKQLWARLR